MKREKFCIGHANGFRHLDEPLGGMEDEFDIGFNFKFDESPDEFVFHPSSLTKAYAEPRLILYISAVHRSQTSARQTLSYGLRRSEFSAGLEPTEQDERELRRRAMRTIELDLEAMKNRQAPKSLKELVMLE